MKELVIDLTPEELAMEAEFENGEYESVTNLEEEKERLRHIARSALAKNKVIAVRLSEKSLIKVKATAAREGLSYQTFIASLIHKHS